MSVLGRLARVWGAVIGAGLLVGPGVASVRAAEPPKVEDSTFESFDGTKIAYTFFLPASATPAAPVPVVLMTHGWSGSREATATGRVATLLRAGYAVLTWDQRGFGDSGGDAEVDSQTAEVRDVRGLIDLVASKPGIRLDAPGDPRLGMLGGSYAGGIQLMTASADSRIDVIVPEIAWNDLVRSLKPNGVLKLGWGLVLTGSGVGYGLSDGLDAPAGPETGSVSTGVLSGVAEGVLLNDWTPDTTEYFAARSPKRYISGGTIEGLGTFPGIRIPTFVIQGANDTLFPLKEGIENLMQIAANGAPVKLTVFCGGHTMNVAGTTCAKGSDQGTRLDAMWLAWFERYLKDQRSVHTGPPVEFQHQDGTFSSAGSLPPLRDAGTGEGTVVNTVAPTSGVGLAGTPAPAGVSFTVPLTADPGETVLGLPRVTVTATGTTTPVVDEAFLYFKLLDVDDAGNAIVVDDQVTPIKLNGLSSGPVTATVDLNGVSWLVQPGHHLELEVAGTSNDYSGSRTAWVVDVTVEADLPVLTASARGGSVVVASASADGSGGAATLNETLPATGGSEATALGAAGLALGAALTLRLSVRRYRRSSPAR